MKKKKTHKQNETQQNAVKCQAFMGSATSVSGILFCTGYQERDKSVALL